MNGESLVIDWSFIGIFPSADTADSPELTTQELSKLARGQSSN
jgi:hypothetical protein